MADTALSALAATTTLASGDLLYVVDGGASRKIDWDNVVAQMAAATKTLTNTTFDANGTGNSISNVETADIAAGSKSGADTTLVTGTAGTSGNLASWNVDGDLVDSGSATSAFATAAQGALADSAVQPGDDADTLGSGAATDGWVLTADGLGGAAWEAVSGGGGSPAGSSGQFQYNNSSAFAAADLWQATNTIEQRNSTNAQTFNIYNTYTDASNYERGFLKWNSNVLEIGAEAAGTGTARNIRFVIGSANVGRFEAFGSGGKFFIGDGFIQKQSGSSGTFSLGGAINFASCNSFVGLGGGSAFGMSFFTDSGSGAKGYKFHAGNSAGAGVGVIGGFNDLSGVEMLFLGDEENAASPAFARSGAVIRTVLGDNSDLTGQEFAYMQAAKAYTVATLPGTPVVGMVARVTDATTPAVGSTVTGGGAAAALVWYNGSNWTVIGV